MAAAGVLPCHLQLQLVIPVAQKAARGGLWGGGYGARENEAGLMKRVKEDEGPVTPREDGWPAPRSAHEGAKAPRPDATAGSRRCPDAEDLSQIMKRMKTEQVAVQTADCSALRRLYAPHADQTVRTVRTLRTVRTVLPAGPQSEDLSRQQRG